MVTKMFPAGCPDSVFVLLGLEVESLVARHFVPESSQRGFVEVVPPGLEGLIAGKPFAHEVCKESSIEVAPEAVALQAGSDQVARLGGAAVREGNHVVFGNGGADGVIASGAVSHAVLAITTAMILSTGEASEVSHALDLSVL